MKLPRISLILGLFVGMAMFAMVSRADSPRAGLNFAADQILVKFKAGVGAAAAQAVHAKYRGAVTGGIPQIGVQIVKVPAGKVEEMVASYKADKSVEFAEPDYVVKAYGVNDPYFSKQWGMTKVLAPQAWVITKGSPAIKIAILDTGVDQHHPDLSAKIVANNNFTDSATVDDLYGHGTHTAGIAAAITNNGIGVAGMSYNCTIMNVKVLDDYGYGQYSWVAGGISWAADNGAKVISMSLGGPSPDSTLKSAVDYAWSKGVVLVAAAGNNGNTSPGYPAFYSNCISVAATDQSDAKASFSTFGTWVSVAAPGVHIYSTLPTHANAIGVLNYGYLDGTSMACPHVAGLAALVWATSYGTSNSSVRNRIQNTADPIAGTGTSWIHGRINAYNAVLPSVNLTMAVSPSGGGSTVPTNGQTFAIPLGQPATIAAAAAVGYVFDHWTGTPGATFNAPSYWRTSTTLSASATVTANFVPSQPSTVWDWGFNSNGQIGDGTIITRPTPRMALGLSNIIQSLPPPPLAGGQYHTLALSSAGTVYAWGKNDVGQLGIGTLVDQHSPASVSKLSNIVWIAAGSRDSVAVDAGGAVWAWGNNAAGQLGDGTKVNRTSPVKVTGLTGVTVLQVAAGDSHTLALDSTGQVWAWGGNTRGQLGNGTTIYSLTPMKVPGLTNATAIAAGMYHSLALDSSGAVWAWGANESGQLGNGTHADSQSPVSVAGLTGVTQVAAGGWHSLAIDSSGSVWTWGANWYGQLGNGTIAQSTTPIQTLQPGSLTFQNAVQVAGGADHSVVLDSTGTVWTTGWNKQGQLGDGTLTDHWYAQAVLGLAGVGSIGAGGWDTLSVVNDPHAAGSLVRRTGSLSGLGSSTAVPSAAPAAGAAPSAASPSAGTTAAPAPSAQGLANSGFSVPCDGIVDDRDHSEAKQFTVLSGAWSSALLGSAYAGSYTYTLATTGPETARVRFSCTALNAGTYDVYAWWPPAPGLGATQVAYEIHHSAGGTTVRVNQSVGGGQWNLLGTFDFEAGSHVVDVHNGASAPGAIVCADAVRFVPAGTDITR